LNRNSISCFYLELRYCNRSNPIEDLKIQPQSIKQIFLIIAEVSIWAYDTGIGGAKKDITCLLENLYFFVFGRIMLDARNLQKDEKGIFWRKKILSTRTP